MDGMGLAVKTAAHTLVVLLLLVGHCARCEEKWCYDLPSCGPKTWAQLGYCSGTRQSPINIVPKRTLSNACLCPLTFSRYEDRSILLSLHNTGHYAEVVMKNEATISGGGLPATYYAKSFHFHWGTQDHPGSEHAINDKRHSMELHIVHTKNNMSMDEAKKDPEGIAVLAFFIQKSKKASVVSAWKTLANMLEVIPEKDNSVELDAEFSLGALLSRADVSKYYRYHGSLTTPNCNEVVIWTVYDEPIRVPHSVVKKFATSLYFTTIKERRRMQKNYRPFQRVNDRKVLYFSESKSPYCINCYNQKEI